MVSRTKSARPEASQKTSHTTVCLHRKKSGKLCRIWGKKIIIIMMINFPKQVCLHRKNCLPETDHVPVVVTNARHLTQRTVTSQELPNLEGGQFVFLEVEVSGRWTICYLKNLCSPCLLNKWFCLFEFFT